MGDRDRLILAQGLAVGVCLCDGRSKAAVSVFSCPKCRAVVCGDCAVVHACGEARKEGS